MIIKSSHLGKNALSHCQSSDTSSDNKICPHMRTDATYFPQHGALVNKLFPLKLAEVPYLLSLQAGYDTWEDLAPQYHSGQPDEGSLPWFAKNKLEIESIWAQHFIHCGCYQFPQAATWIASWQAGCACLRRGLRLLRVLCNWRFTLLPEGAGAHYRG